MSNNLFSFFFLFQNYNCFHVLFNDILFCIQATKKNIVFFLTPPFWKFGLVRLRLVLTADRRLPKSRPSRPVFLSTVRCGAVGWLVLCSDCVQVLFRFCSGSVQVVFRLLYWFCIDFIKAGLDLVLNWILDWI